MTLPILNTSCLYAVKAIQYLYLQAVEQIASAGYPAALCSMEWVEIVLVVYLA